MIKMQPDDWIAREDIRDEDHLERIREAVQTQGWTARKRYGAWQLYEKWPCLRLDVEGDLVWSAQCSGRHIDPAELLGKGHPAAGILHELARAADVNPEPWREFQVRSDPGGEWDDCRSFLSLCWHLAHKEVRRRPRTIRIGEFDVPEPVRKWPADGENIWAADPMNEKRVPGCRVTKTLRVVR